MSELLGALGTLRGRGSAVEESLNRATWDWHVDNVGHLQDPVRLFMPSRAKLFLIYKRSSKWDTQNKFLLACNIKTCSCPAREIIGCLLPCICLVGVTTKDSEWLEKKISH